AASRGEAAPLAEEAPPPRAGRVSGPWLRWEALGLEAVASLMEGFPRPWWIAAGHAVELHVGRPVRSHEDVDVLFLRDDQDAVRRHLRGWDVQVAHRGKLEPWPDGTPIELPRSNLWARRDPDGPWQLQLMLAEHDGEMWWFRRD